MGGTFRTELYLECDYCDTSLDNDASATFDNMDIEGPPTLGKLTKAAIQAGWTYSRDDERRRIWRCPKCSDKNRSCS